MSARCLLPALLLVLVLSPSAQAVNKDKLRQAARMPRVTAQIGFFKFDSSIGLMAMDAKAPPPKAPEAVLQMLQAAPTNADLYAELAESYEANKKTDLAKQARQQAAALYTQNIKQQPNNVLLYVKLAKMLEEDKADDAEKLLRWAVQAAPGEPQCWLALADHLRWRTGVVLFGPTRETMSFQQMAETLVAKNPGAPALTKALQLLDEHEACFNKAIAAAPHRADLYLRRFGERTFWGCAIRSPVEVLLGKVKAPRNVLESICSPANLADLRKAAQLDPNNHLVFGALGALELMIGFQKSVPNPLQTPWTALPETTRTTVLDCTARLEKFAASNDPAVAVASADFLAAIHGLKGDFKAAIPWLAQIVKLRPDDDENWNKLLGFMTVTDHPDLVVQGRKWVEHKDTAHTRYLLAKAYLHDSDFAAAEAEVRAALKHDVNDFRANLGLVALLLRRSDKANTLHEARLHLEKVPPHIKDLMPDQKIDVLLMCAIYLGLADDTKSAREFVNTVLQHQPQHEEARALLQYLSD